VCRDPRWRRDRRDNFRIIDRRHPIHRRDDRDRRLAAAGHEIEIVASAAPIDVHCRHDVFAHRGGREIDRDDTGGAQSRRVLAMTSRAGRIEDDLGSGFDASNPSRPFSYVAIPAVRARARPSDVGSIPHIAISSRISLRSNLTIRSVPILPEPTIAHRIRGFVSPDFIRRISR